MWTRPPDSCCPRPLHWSYSWCVGSSKRRWDLSGRMPPTATSTRSLYKLHTHKNQSSYSVHFQYNKKNSWNETFKKFLYAQARDSEFAWVAKILIDLQIHTEIRLAFCSKCTHSVSLWAEREPSAALSCSFSSSQWPQEEVAHRGVFSFRLHRDPWSHLLVLLHLISPTVLQKPECL